MPVQNINPHTITPTTSAAITDQSHSSRMRWLSGVMPFGHPSPSACCQLQPLSVSAKAANVVITRWRMTGTASL